MIRLVDEERLLDVLQRQLEHAFRPGGDTAIFRRWLRRQPTEPDLVSAGTAAQMLGVPHSHIARLGREGVLRPIPIEGTAATYMRVEVRRAADARAKERKR